MTLKDLLRRFRALADDTVETYLWQDEDITDWLNDAQDQACVRGRLLVAEGDPALCQIALQPGQATYLLHRALYEIISLRIVAATGESRSLALKTREWLDAELRDWRDYPRPACFAIQTDTGLRVVGAIEASDVLHLEAYRLPISPMLHGSDEPELHLAHHEHLIHWALQKAYSVPDSEKFDPTRKDQAEAAFTQYFGPLPDADMRRQTRSDAVHHNKVILP